jgi:hypothetical protein
MEAPHVGAGSRRLVEGEHAARSPRSTLLRRIAHTPRALGRVASLTLLLALVLMASGGGSASAAVVGAAGVSASSSVDSSSVKSVTASCPAGKRVVGAGGSIGVLSGDGQVVMDDLRPNPTLTSVTVQGVEDETGLAEIWALAAEAVCAYPPPGLERVSATSPVDSNRVKNLTASCPAGKLVVGTGGDINNGSGQVEMDDIRPNGTLTSVTVQGIEDETGYAGLWSLTAYAICADPIAGLQRVSATSPLDSNAKNVTATCPLGKRVLGTGSDINNGNGQVIRSALNSSAPPFPLAATSGRAWAAEDANGYAGLWSLTAYAICAPSWQRVEATFTPNVNSNTPNSDSPKVAEASCSGGARAVGAGGRIVSGSGQVGMNDLAAHYPSAIVEGLEDENGYSANWDLSAFAICTTPLPGIQPIVASGTRDSTSVKSVTANCPAGKRVVNAGGSIHFFDPLTGDEDHPATEQVELDDLRPNATLTSVTVQGIEDENGYSLPWSLDARAICADPVAGLERVSATSPLDSTRVKSVTDSCPAGKRVLGTGSDINNGNGQVIRSSLVPTDALTRVGASAVEDETGYSAPWSVTAYAICAIP